MQDDLTTANNEVDTQYGESKHTSFKTEESLIIVEGHKQIYRQQHITKTSVCIIAFVSPRDVCEA